MHVVDATFGSTSAGFLHTAREQAELLLARGAENASSVAPDLTFRSTVLEGSPTGVVVGVDGSEASLAAAQFAAHQADRLSERLTALYCWSAPAPWTENSAMNDWPMEPDSADRLVLAEAVGGLAERYPDLELDLRLDLGLPVDALVAAGTGAWLLVVGNHGRHGFARFWLGSLSHVLVLTMPCPVAVIRADVTEAAPI